MGLKLVIHAAQASGPEIRGSSKDTNINKGRIADACSHLDTDGISPQIFCVYQICMFVQQLKNLSDQRLYYRLYVLSNKLLDGAAACEPMGKDSADFFAYRGIARFWLNDHHGASEDLTEAKQRNCTILHETCLYLASVQALASDFRLALITICEVLDENSHSSFDGLLIRGAIYQCLGEHILAIRDFSRILTHHPLHGPALFRRGISRRFIHQYDGASEDLLTAMESEPDNPLLRIDFKDELNPIFAKPDGVHFMTLI